MHIRNYFVWGQRISFFLPHSVFAVLPFVVSLGVLQGKQVSPAFALYISAGQSVQDVNGAGEVSPAAQLVQGPFPALDLKVPGEQGMQFTPAVHCPPCPAAQTEKQLCHNFEKLKFPIW